MASTYVNEDGVQVVVAPPVVLESSTGLGEIAWPPGWQHHGLTDETGEVATDVDGDSAGE